MSRRRRSVPTLVLVLAAAVSALAPAAAQAIGVSGVQAAPADTTAGAHSDFTLSFSVTGASDNLRDVQVDLPTGLLGNPSATPVRCTESQLRQDACPQQTEVGSTTSQIVAHVGPVPVPLTVTGSVYNVVPPADEPARLGIVLRPAGGVLGRIVLINRIRVRDESDYGLENRITGIPRDQSGIPFDITGLSLTLRGRAPGGGAFMINPTQCATATTRVTITSYASSRPQSGSGSFRPTACDSEPFAPGMEIRLGDHHTDTPTDHAITLTQPGDVGGRQVSEVRRAVVRLPEGTSFNPSLAPGLQVCSDAQFGAQGAPAHCPARSLIGHVAFDNPLLGTVPGDVYFGRTAKDPYRLMIIGEKAGVTVKIKASVHPDPQTAQITTVFDDLPQVPFTRFELTFLGGPEGVLVTPPTCGTFRGSITATPWSGTAPQTPTTEFAVSDDGNGGCAPHEIASLSTSLSTHRALGSPALGLDLIREPTSRRPRRLDVTLPAGLLGRVQSFPQCPTSKAVRAACPRSTRLGSLVSTVGSGPHPIELPGEVFLGTGTSKAVARLWLAIRVNVGPFDFGHLVLQNPLTLGQSDGRATVSAELPAAFHGFPVALRRLRMTIDRKGFMVNPSGCDGRAFGVTLTGVDGTTGGAADPFAATGCGALPFHPSVSTSIEDPKARDKGDRPPLRTEISTSPRYSALRDVRLLVSAGLIPNTNALLHVCTAEQLAARACPPDTRIGTVSAVTPLLGRRLSGPVHLAFDGTRPADEPGIELPFLVATLDGPGVHLRLDGELRLTDDAGRLEAHFHDLPDVQLSSFRLDIDGAKGAAGAPPFVAASALCAAAFAPSDVALISHSGRRVTRQPFLDPAACRTGSLVRASAANLSSSRPSLVVDIRRHPHAKHAIRSATFRLPGGLRTRSARGSGLRVTVDGRRLSRRHVKLTRKGTVSVHVVKRGGAQRIRVVASRGAITTSRSLRARGRKLLTGLSGAGRVRLAVAVTTREVRSGHRGRTRVVFGGRG